MFAEPHCGSFQFKGNSQVFIILVNVMQLQYMRMLDQFQNGNLPLNLVRDKKGRKQKGIERRKDTSADEGVRTVQTLVETV